MAVGALVEDVGGALNRAHGLFGQPDPAAGTAPSHVSSTLAGAVQLVGHSQHRMVAVSGVLRAAYGMFASDAAPRLGGVLAADHRLGSQIHDAVQADWTGWSESGSVVKGAAADGAILALVQHIPAGQRALITALRGRLAQQQRIVNEYSRRDARLAAALRALSYGRASGGAGLPLGAMRCGGVGGGAGGGGAFSALGGLIRPPAVLGHGRGTAWRVPVSGWPAGTPLGALTLDSGPREVASAIIGEARRRGYSPYQTTAILADAIQESGLNPRAASPNKLWLSIFQQDGSYPGRRNPNLAIAGFFDRLDRHGGPGSPDIWKSIFWLQQRPGDPSAMAAYSHGRQGYLNEVMQQHQRAIALYHDIVGGRRL